MATEILQKWHVGLNKFMNLIVFWSITYVLPFQISNDESDFDITKIFEKLRNLEHPNLIRHFWITKYPNHINICLQYIPGLIWCICFIYLSISLVLHFHKINILELGFFLEESKLSILFLKYVNFIAMLFSVIIISEYM